MNKYVNTLDTGHYYASSVAEWHVDNDLEKLIKFFKSEDFPFTISFVPLPIDADYEIRNYAPDVAGRVVIAKYRKEK